ncbi:MAG TPA: zinc ribbon domain-containing protein [Acidimicrobiia bacterium]|nr:zinc ribbon domain-containing protein [Acidimicrobiia bacterium]
MPMYEYQCQKCGKHFDVEQRMIDPALTTHDECGGDVVKVFSSAGIVLKGSGFYKTDTRSTAASQTKNSKKADTGSNTGDSSSASPTETKKAPSEGSPSPKTDSKSSSSTPSPTKKEK